MLTHCGTIEIKTDRLYLRPFKYNDDDNMLKYWISDPKIQSMISEPVYSTKEEVKELLDKYISSYQNNSYYRWAITEKESLICIGQIAIYLVNEKNHWCELEYCIGSQFHRKGYATEATKAIIDFGFINVNLLYSDYRHVSGTHVAIFGVVRTRIQHIYSALESFHF